MDGACCCSYSWRLARLLLRPRTGLPPARPNAPAVPPPRPRPPGAGRDPGANPPRPRPGAPPPGAPRPGGAPAPVGRGPPRDPAPAAGAPGADGPRDPGAGREARGAWNGLLPPGRGRGRGAANGLLPPGRGRGRGAASAGVTAGLSPAGSDASGSAAFGLSSAGASALGAGVLGAFFSASGAGAAAGLLVFLAAGFRCGLRALALGRLRLRGLALGGRLLGRGEGLAGLADDGGFERRGRSLDVLAHLNQFRDQVFARNAELFRDLVNAGLCHNSPVSVRPRQGRTIVSERNSFRGTHRALMGVIPFFRRSMVDGLVPGRSRRTEEVRVRQRRARVRLGLTQGPPDGSPLARPVPAFRCGVQVRSPSRHALRPIDHDASAAHDQPHEVRPRSPFPASDAGAHGTGGWVSRRH